MKTICTIFLLLFARAVFCQELYVFTEPASNMPSKSVSVRLTARYPTTNSFRQRYMPEVMIGVSKWLMVHVSGTVSDYYTGNLRAESGRLYAKYRFYSHDDVHKHFRLAAFGDVAVSNNPYLYDDVSLEGDNSGMQFGLIATQLVNKLAVSSTVSYTDLFAVSSNKLLTANPSDHLFNYSLSAGYLLLPKTYTNYNQLNVNAYAELLGVKSLDNRGYNIDLAPAVQCIFNSNTKVNLGYRFQLYGNMNRIGNNTWQIAIEHTFFNCWK